MKLNRLFIDAINNDDTQFFVIDSGNYEQDNDFVTYEWSRRQNNKIRAGDVFIYRKPQKLSSNGQFYFYGAGQFGKVEGEIEATGHIINPHPFKNPIFQSELETFRWEWKPRGQSWEHYWNQYGINQITKNDFLRILDLTSDDSYETIEDEEVVKYKALIAKGDYFVDDELSIVKVRSWQRAWSDKVKMNYGYLCAMCDISTPEFLVGSHILPASKDKNNRMNPSNGLCLCVLHDKAFDRGYLGLNAQLEIIYSDKFELDKYLNIVLRQNTRKQLRKPKFYYPNLEFLEIHRHEIFK